jgi:hypothetical protein
MDKLLFADRSEQTAEVPTRAEEKPTFARLQTAYSMDDL